MLVSNKQVNWSRCIQGEQMWKLQLEQLLFLPLLPLITLPIIALATTPWKTHLKKIQLSLCCF